MLRRPVAAGGTGDANEDLPAMPAAAHVALLSACECLMLRYKYNRSMEGGSGRILAESKEKKKACHPEILPSNRPSISFVDPCANFTAQKQSTIRNC